MDIAKNNWESIYQSIGNDIPKTDDWLDKYDKQIAQSKDTPIIDLGCGFGNDTLYLTQQGYKVISCDYSKKSFDEDLSILINDPDCRCLDMRENLPFDSQSAQIIICDLSLHYFSEADTVSLIKGDKEGALCRRSFALSCQFCFRAHK